jgi:hypothetical protein
MAEDLLETLAVQGFRRLASQCMCALLGLSAATKPHERVDHQKLALHPQLSPWKASFVLEQHTLGSSRIGRKLAACFFQQR